MKGLLLLCLLLLPLSVFSGEVFQPQEKNLVSEQKETSRFLDDLSRGKPTGQVSSRHVSDSFGAPVSPARWSGPLNFKGENAYQTNESLDAMTALSIAGLQSFGTPAQGEMAARMSDYGQKLSASGNPTLVAAGGNLQDQAAATNAGDLAGAQSASQGLRSLPRMSLPYGYRPSSADMTWSGAMADVGKEFSGAFAEAAGEAAATLAASAIESYFTKSATTSTAGTTKAGKTSAISKAIGAAFGKVSKGVVTGKNSPKTVAGSFKGIASQTGDSLGTQAGGGSGNSGLPSQSTTGTLPSANREPAGGTSVPINASGGGSADGQALPR